MLESCGDNAEKIRIHTKRNSDNSINVRQNEDYTLIVGLKRMNNSKTLKAHCPMFLKGKDESWFLILGDIQNRELWALKRVSGVNSQQRHHQLQFTAPSILGKLTDLFIIYISRVFFPVSETIKIWKCLFPGPMKLTFYLISDCYMGLDQQYNIYLNVVGDTSRTFEIQE